MSLWIKHPNTGRYDTMLSLSIWALVVVLFKFTFSEITIGSLSFGQLDSGVVAAILGPTLGALAFKKHSDNMVAKDKKDV